jgi:hypothetical protein
LLDLARTGQAFAVKNGIQIMVLERGGWVAERTRVHILDGQMVGKSGWVPTEFVSS